MRDLISLAPVNQLFSLSAAAYALVADGLDAEGDASGGNIAGLLELKLAIELAAPHSLDIAAVVVCDLLELLKRSSLKGSVLAVLECLLIDR